MVHVMKVVQPRSQLTVLVSCHGDNILNPWILAPDQDGLNEYNLSWAETTVFPTMESKLKRSKPCVIPAVPPSLSIEIDSDVPKAVVGFKL